jgi:hypothetical protein
VEEMAKAHPAFQKVYENYLGIKSGNWKPSREIKFRKGERRLAQPKGLPHGITCEVFSK